MSLLSLVSSFNDLEYGAYAPTGVYLYEDFATDSLSVVKDIFAFLNVRTSYVPPDIGHRYNVSGLPKGRLRRAAHYIATQRMSLKEVAKPLIPEHIRVKLRKSLFSWSTKPEALYKPELSVEARRELLNFYYEDIRELESLVDRDLSAWLQER